jgi:hypothetical protein
LPALAVNIIIVHPWDVELVGNFNMGRGKFVGDFNMGTQ